MMAHTRPFWIMDEANSIELRPGVECKGISCTPPAHLSLSLSLYMCVYSLLQIMWTLKLNCLDSFCPASALLLWCREQSMSRTSPWLKFWQVTFHPSVLLLLSFSFAYITLTLSQLDTLRNPVICNWLPQGSGTNSLDHEFCMSSECVLQEFCMSSDWVVDGFSMSSAWVLHGLWMRPARVPSELGWVLNEFCIVWNEFWRRAESVPNGSWMIDHWNMTELWMSSKWNLNGVVKREPLPCITGCLWNWLPASMNSSGFPT